MNGSPEERTPVPDPTKLTTDAVNQALDISRRELASLRDLMCQRMDGMDHAERQLSIRLNERFDQIETLRTEQKNDVKAAVDAALAAQKEAIGKSEQATKEQISSLAETQRTADEALRRDIDDLKSRMTTVEATKLGSQEKVSQFNASATVWIAGLGLLVAVLSAAIIVVLAQAAGG